MPVSCVYGGVDVTWERRNGILRFPAIRKNLRMTNGKGTQNCIVSDGGRFYLYSVSSE